MTLTQLEYIVALDKHRHFIAAAEHCFVTQPTLSMGVKKLEEELGVVLFDRKQNPLVPTKMGEQIILKAKQLLKLSNELITFVDFQQNQLSGPLRIGVIPTLAPYIVPMFFKAFINEYPEVKLVIEELQSHVLLEQLREELIDVAILVTPVKGYNFTQIPLYDEPFVAYCSEGHKLLAQKTLQMETLSTDDLWVLNQGHCFRNQVLNICNVAHGERDFIYESGTIETLRKMVDQNIGYTLLPFSAIEDLSPKSKKRVRYFNAPQPMREVSILVNGSSPKKKLVELLKTKILSELKHDLTDKEEKGQIVPW